MPADLLDATANDVGRLDDSQLRALIARLCEAEVERKGLPRTAVTSGGHQDAKDGGVDVRVELPSDPAWCGNIPRPATIFQSKNSKMAPAAIREEMRPEGILRPSIVEVLRRGGAYVMVSNREIYGVADVFLQQRKAAMEEAVRPDVPEHLGVLDFYDSSRLASWVRSHPEVMLWLRNVIGKPLQGWKNWEQLWSAHDTDFLQDEALRLRVPNASEDAGMDALQGIATLRDALRPEGACVRLAGLSGFGKTRLVVALFEAKVGANALAASEMVYTDISDEPFPLPLELCRQLHARNRASVLVVDNCPPILHAQLTKFVKESNARLRLLTVEYDVQEEEVDETAVFRLESASDDLIERLVAKRFPELQPTDPEVIAGFSNGNARVAIALAKTVCKGEKLTGLKDNELFRRLFHQRHDQSRQLLQVARCSSLLYSFQFTAKDVDYSPELLVLAELAGIEPGLFLSQVQELKNRGLLQTRSTWAAILPHAIANRLAKESLERISVQKLLRLLGTEGRERMLKSFARRLGYLADSTVAQHIVGDWLSPGGMLGALQDLDAERFSWFERVAPVAESEALDAYERALNATSGLEGARYRPCEQHAERLLRLLAYQPVNFAKVIDLLRVYIARQDDAEARKHILERCSALFALRFSGTMAPPEEKLGYLRRLFQDAVTVSDREIALDSIKHALDNPRYLYHHAVDFGGRVRSFGYQIGSEAEFVQWYRDVLRFVEDQILSGGWDSGPMKAVLAKKFQSLWESCGVKADLESLAVRLNEAVGWVEGFNAVRSTIRHGKRFGGAAYSAEDFKRLEDLQRSLRPLNLASRVRLVVSPGYRIPFEEMDDLDGESPVKLADVDAAIVEELKAVGEELALDLPTLERMLPELLDSKLHKSWGLMHGVVNRVEDVREFWAWLEACLTRLEPQQPSYSFLGGVVRGLLERDHPFAQELLDRLVDHSRWGSIFPLMQILLPFDSGAASRLVRSIRCELAPVWHFHNLGAGRRHEALADDDLIAVLDALRGREGGGEVVLDLLGMRFFGLAEESYRPCSNLVRYTQRFLTELHALEKVADHHVQTLVAVALEGDSSYEPSVAFARNLAEIQNTKLFVQDLRKTFEELIRRQPRSILDGYLMHLDSKESLRPGYTDSPSSPTMSGFDDPFEAIPDDLMEEWYRLDPEERLPRLVRHVRLYRYDSSQGRVVWRGFVLPMILESQTPSEHLEAVFEGFFTGHWSGSADEILVHYIPLLRDLEALADHTDVVDWARRKLEHLDQQIASWKDFHNRCYARGTSGFE